MKKENKKQNKRNKIESIPKQYGWICPKCGSVWAPWVDQCKNKETEYAFQLMIIFLLLWFFILALL